MEVVRGKKAPMTLEELNRETLVQPGRRNIRGGELAKGRDVKKGGCNDCCTLF